MSLQDGVARGLWKPGAGFGGALAAGAARALDLVFPHQPFDGQGRTLSSGLSAEAWSRIRFIAEPCCDGCGVPFEYDIGSRCAACLARPRAYARARAACLYDEHSRDLVLKLKHADRIDLAGVLAAWVSRAAGDLLAEADAIVPVPLHPWRLLGRRYNQAAEIARPLARRAHVPYRPGLLVRARATPSQGGRSGAGRRRNVAGAFAAPGRARAAIVGQRILLVDDVLTTGATAEACAKALLAAGAGAVDLAVVARVRETPSPSI